MVHLAVICEAIGCMILMLLVEVIVECSTVIQILLVSSLLILILKHILYIVMRLATFLPANNNRSNYSTVQPSKPSDVREHSEH